MKIKLYKGDRFKSVGYSLGVTRSDWQPTFREYVIPANRASIDIEDGHFFDNAGNPVSAIDIAKELLKQNKNQWVYGGKGGSFKKEYYGKHFFIDYYPQLKDIFEQHKLPIPEDGKSIQDRAVEAALAQLKVAGVIDSDFDSSKLTAFQAMQKAKEEVKTEAPKTTGKGAKKTENKEEVKAG